MSRLDELTRKARRAETPDTAAKARVAARVHASTGVIVGASVAGAGAAAGAKLGLFGWLAKAVSGTGALLVAGAGASAIVVTAVIVAQTAPSSPHAPALGDPARERAPDVAREHAEQRALDVPTEHAVEPLVEPLVEPPGEPPGDRAEPVVAPRRAASVARATRSRVEPELSAEPLADVAARAPVEAAAPDTQAAEPSVEAPSLAPAIARLREVDHLLRSGEHARAVELLDVPVPSELAEERDALAAVAQCGLDPEHARSHVTRFARMHVSSPFFRRVISACGVDRAR